MAKISGVIITYNEEKLIENCLRSIQDVVDEIVVIDSYSTDRTKEICESFGVRFIENPFLGFETQKNFAAQCANFDYVLSLDADEELSTELKAHLLDLKPLLTLDGYSFNRLNNYCGKWIKHSGWYPDCKIRLFNKNKARWIGENNIHEVVVLNNPSSHGFIKGDLLHWAYQSNTEHYLKINKYTDIAAKNYVENNHKKISVFKVVSSTFVKFIRNYFIKRGFLDGYEGFLISFFSAMTTFMKYVKIKELQDKVHKSSHEDRF